MDSISDRILARKPIAAVHLVLYSALFLFSDAVFEDAGGHRSEVRTSRKAEWITSEIDAFHWLRVLAQYSEETIKGTLLVYLEMSI